MTCTYDKHLVSKTNKAFPVPAQRVPWEVFGLPLRTGVTSRSCRGQCKMAWHKYLCRRAARRSSPLGLAPIHQLLCAQHPTIPTRHARTPHSSHFWCWQSNLLLLSIRRIQCLNAP